MAITTTTRFGLTRWSDPGDAFTRAQTDASHAAIEAKGAIYLQGIASARPVAGTVGRFYYASDTTALSYDDGVGWRTVFDPTTVTTAGTQTLANKTLTSPIISTISNTGVLTLPTSTDTLVGRATTDTMTNKTMSGANNTFSAIPQSAVTNLGTDLGLKAPIASPTFTGTVTVVSPTATGSVGVRQTTVSSAAPASDAVGADGDVWIVWV